MTNLIIHANWSAGSLRLWAESVERWSGRAESTTAASTRHPFAAEPDSISAALGPSDLAAKPAELTLRLPASDGIPLPSAKLAHALGHTAAGAAPIAPFTVPCLAVEPADAGAALDTLEDLTREQNLTLGPGVLFFAAAMRLSRSLMAQQRFVPSLRQESTGDLHAAWQPWLGDALTAQRAVALARAMPPIARAALDPLAHNPWAIVEDFLSATLDAQCRRVLIGQDMRSAIAERDADADSHVAWLDGLLGGPDGVHARAPARSEMVKGVRKWIAGLEDRGTSSAWRLCLRLGDPPDANLLADMQDPGDDVHWPLTFHLQSQENPRLIIDATDIWLVTTDSLTVEGRRVDNPQELLLAELARAARLYPPLERALDESEPAELNLSTRQAYQFLREYKPVLAEQGFGVESPEWWDSPAVRLGARLKLMSDPLESMLAGPGPGTGGAAGTRLGLGALVHYNWEIAIGGTTLTLHEFEQLASKRTPLVRINGQWVEIRPEDVRAAIRFIQENPGGEMRISDAIRLAFGTDLRQSGIPVVGLEATGWASAFFGQSAGNEQIPMIEPPAGFHGSLRPYQLRGLAWMAFLERFGFGPCLADDMGLGKTIQLLALLVHEREEGLKANRARGLDTHGLPPTLLIVPMSVVGNWVHEAKRFCPQLKFLVHHGIERITGDEFLRAVEASDAVITTYALAHRDREMLQRIQWQRIVLDEAQYIKNPTTKQATAVRSLPSITRVALTGTPVENRLGELWSILEFLNPGYLGTAGAFRKRFAVPVERYRDNARGKQLRELVRPFILRRLKTDPAVAADLPEKLESREFCHLTSEQAQLYESLVGRMMGAVEKAEGIQRRGLVLATLVRLKQVCNHPSLMLKDYDASSPQPPNPSRSGKCIRLIEMLDEVLSGGEQALIFTQFRSMAQILAPMLRHELDREILLFHGGTTQAQRQTIVDTFQKADGSAPILVVSLKAGGVGLNLTAATHVFHFDRWWNPAVENQATDRAHRIGQGRTVNVHKFVVRGTLEERIDEMIEQKTALADTIISSGERWLTELSTDQLRDMLTLRRDAVGDEGE